MLTESQPSYPEFPRFDDQMITKLADSIASSQSLNIQKGDIVVMNCDDWGIQIYNKLKIICESRGAELRLAFNGVTNITEELKNLQLRVNHLEERRKPPMGGEVQNEADLMDSWIQNETDLIAGSPLYENANKMIALRGFPELNLDKVKEIKEPVKAAYERSAQKNREARNGFDNIVILMPTPKEAEIANMPVDEYYDMFIKACTRDYEAVHRAQQKLIERLQKGKTLTITQAHEDAPEGWQNTNLTIDIEQESDTPTWANSVIARNLPGSEVFTAPHSVNGIFTVYGAISICSEVLQGIKLTIKDNQIDIDKIDILLSEQDKDRYDDILKKVKEEFKLDPGASKIGELGIGTNPVLQGILVNAVLAEKKIGIHLGIGNSYHFVKYYPNQGEVDLDNGVRSKEHFDLASGTFMGMTIQIDEQVLMKDGVFLDENGSPDPELAVLSVSSADVDIPLP